VGAAPLGILYALVTVLAWGTWLAPSQNVPFRSQQIKTFYVAAANLALALLVTLLQPASSGAARLTWQTFLPPFIGGLVWSVSGLCAFTATDKLGIARAFGIWAPLNIIVSILWGALLFDEFLALTPLNQFLLFASLAVILAGVLMIILPKEDRPARALSRRDLLSGLLGAVGAGVLWGSYYLPNKMSQVSVWVTTLPLAVGIFTGSALLFLFTRQPLRLEKGMDYLRVVATGLLWGIGNYGMLLLVDQLGAGKGFTISQLSVVVNAAVGVFVLKNPAPRTRAATLTLIGCVLATVGGIVLGNL
jgi:glucose uptake protein